MDYQFGCLCVKQHGGGYITKTPLEYGRSLKKLLGCGASTWYTLFVGWIECSLNTFDPISIWFFKI